MFLEEIREVEKTNYAINNEESQEGVVGIGTPIRDYRGNVHAAIAASVMKSRFEKEKDKLISEVIQTGKSISQKMGFKIEDSAS